jgi:hypothetical protein
LFDNGAKMDYITRDMLEFVKEWFYDDE